MPTCKYLKCKIMRHTAKCTLCRQSLKFSFPLLAHISFQISQTHHSFPKLSTFSRGLLMSAAGGENGEALLFEAEVGLSNVQCLLLILALEVGRGVTVGARLPAGGIPALAVTIVMGPTVISPARRVVMVVKVVVATIMVVIGVVVTATGMGVMVAFPPSPAA